MAAVDNVVDYQVQTLPARMLVYECKATGTTSTIQLPAGTRVLGVWIHNRTTNAIMGHAAAATEVGNYVESTGVYTTPLTVDNDDLTIVFLVK